MILLGIGTVASNDSSAIPATHPDIEIRVNYDCSDGRVHYHLKGMVEGDSFSALGTTVYYPKRELISAFDQPPGEYWIGHIFTHHGEDFDGKRKVEVKKCGSTTTTSTPTTSPVTTVTSSSTTSIPDPSTSSTGPITPTTDPVVTTVVTSSKSDPPSQTKTPKATVPFTIPATK